MNPTNIKEIPEEVWGYEQINPQGIVQEAEVRTYWRMVMPKS